MSYKAVNIHYDVDFDNALEYLCYTYSREELYDILDLGHHTDCTKKQFLEGSLDDICKVLEEAAGSGDFLFYQALNLPEEVDIPDNIDIKDKNAVADYVSDKTGYAILYLEVEESDSK